MKSKREKFLTAEELTGYRQWLYVSDELIVVYVHCSESRQSLSIQADVMQ